METRKEINAVVNMEAVINATVNMTNGGSGLDYLPVATQDTLGGVIVGDGLTITQEGVLSVDMEVIQEVINGAEFDLVIKNI